MKRKMFDASGEHILNCSTVQREIVRTMEIVYTMVNAIVVRHT